MNEYTVNDYRAAAQRAVDAGNIEAAKELARRGIALQAKPGDTSFSTGFAVGDQRTKATVADYLATMQENPGSFQRLLRTVQKTGAEYLGNPVREFVGLDPIDFDKVNEDEAKRLRALADSESEALEKLVEETGFKSMSTEDIKGLKSLAQFAGQKTGESLPQMLSTVASGGFGPLLQMGFFQPSELAENLKGIDELSEEDRVSYAAAGGALMGALDVVGLGQIFKGVPDAALGKLGAGEIYKRLVEKGLKKEAADFAKAAAMEGVTEGLQEATSMSIEALAGKNITFDEATGRLKEASLSGSIVGGTVRAPISAANVTADLFSKDGKLNPEALEGNAAAGSVARRLQRIAQSNGYNLKDVDRGGGAMNALENTRNEVVGEIDALKTALKKRLKPNKHTELSELLNVFAQAQTGIKQGKNKVATKVTKENFDALKTLVGDTQEGQLLLQKLQESNVITDLFQNGLKGGISQYTDYFNPLSSSGSIYDPGRGANIATSVLTGGGLFATGGPAALGAQAAGVVGGRAVDALTGRRSKINRFTNAYVKEQPFSPPTAPSIADIEAQTEMAETAQKRQRQEEIAALKDKLGAPDNDASPIGKMLLGTGLDRAGLKATLSELKDATEGSYVGEMAQSALDNLNGDTNRVSELSELIAITNAYLNKNNLADRRVAQPDSLLAQRDLLSLSSRAEQEGGAASVASSPNYQRGIVANQAMAARLKNDMLSDMDITARDKALLEVTMEALAQPLSNPVPSIDYMIESLKNDGVDEAAIDTYVKPYRERVQMQQMRNMSAPKFENPEISFEDAMASIDMDAPAQPALSEVLNQPSETELDTDPPALSQPKEAPQEAQQETLAAPVLQQPKVSTPPVLSAVKEEAPPVRALFNIGEPGGEFENGIQDLETAAKLSAALGQTVELFRNYEDMLSVAGHKVDKNRNIRGLFRSSQKGASGRVFGLLPGAQLPSGQKITSIDALSTFLHEASHGIAKGSFDGSNQYTSAALMSNNNWEAVIDGIINDRTDATKATVRDEIIDLQENRDVATVLNPEEKRSVRATREKMAQKEQLRSMMQQEGAPSDVIDARMQEIDMKYMRPYRAYYQQRSEFAVDPLWVYLINPKLAKKLMPETTKLIAENFRAAKNPKLQFYAHPIGVAVAAMMAMLFQGEEDEQERFVA